MAAHGWRILAVRCGRYGLDRFFRAETCAFVYASNDLQAIVLTGETPDDKWVKYRVRIIYAAGALLAFGRTYPMTDFNRLEDQLESTLDYYSVSRLMSDVLQRVH